MAGTIKCEIVIRFEYPDIEEAAENIDAMLEEIFEQMEDQFCSEIEGKATKLIAIGQ